LVQAVLLVFRGIVLGLLALLPSLVQACSCAGVTSTPCDTGWNLGDTIFLGKTIAMDKVTWPQSDASLSSFAARFTVEEGFRGAVVGEVVVYTGAGGGDCGYPFVPGTSYLVYATRSATDGLLRAGICSETKPAITAGGVLRELRALQDHTRSDDVFGTIGMAPRGARFDDLVESQSLDGVSVRATTSGGVSFSTKTDARGVYAFTSLPRGTYTIEPDLPPGFSRRTAPLIAEVDSRGFACRVDHFARPDGQIEGILQRNGQPLGGFVTIQPADPSEVAAAQQRGGLPGYDAGPDGKFSLPQLAPGRYRLVFHPRVAGVVDFRATYYWPSSPDDAITLAFGQHLDAIRWELTLGPPR
jgi:hypothetical protein